MPLLYGSIAGYRVRNPAGAMGFLLRVAATLRRAALRCGVTVVLRDERRPALRLLAMRETSMK